MNEKGLEKLKIEYFQNMIRYYIHEKMTLDCAKSFQIIYDTLVADDKNEIDPAGTQKKTSFDNFVIFLLVASHDKEKMELLQVVKEKYARELEAAGQLQNFVHKLLTFELLPLNEKEISQEMSDYAPFQESTENSVLHLREFIRQLIQHNIRVIEKYYSRVRIATLANLIGVPEDRAE